MYLFAFVRALQFRFMLRFLHVLMAFHKCCYDFECVLVVCFWSNRSWKSKHCNVVTPPCNWSPETETTYFLVDALLNFFFEIKLFTFC